MTESSNETNQYEKSYSEGALWDKIVKFASVAGIKAIYAVLLLFYALKNPKIPMKLKTIVLGALGYFIVPFDIVPDLIPIAGYGDDIGVVIAALVAIAFFIDDDTRAKAKAKLAEWFPNYDPEDISSVDQTIDDARSKNDSEASADAT